MGAEVGAAVAIGSLAHGLVSAQSAKKQAAGAATRENAMALLETQQRDQTTAEHSAAVIAEAERERAQAIDNQRKQNNRINLIAGEAAANELAIAENAATRAGEQAGIVRKQTAQEAARIEDLSTRTQSSQVAAAAGSGVEVGSGGTVDTILTDTRTRAGKDLKNLNEAAASQLNLLESTADFARTQGKKSAQNILESAYNTTSTNMENILGAGDTLVANAKINAQTEKNQADLQNLLTLGSAAQYSEQVARYRSDTNAKMWATLLSSNVFSPTNVKAVGSLL